MLGDVTEKRTGKARKVWEFYRDGFRNMTWGRPLIWLVLLKIFILFAILRVFFFRPAMAGMSEREKSEAVGERITRAPYNQKDTLNLSNN